MPSKRERYTPTDIGPSPESWADPYLSVVAPFISNGFVGTATPHYAEETDEGAVKYLYGMNIRPNKIDPRGLRYINSEFHASQSKTELRTGDLLMVQSGHIGTVAMVPEDLDGANCHALIISRLDQDKADPRFLSQYLNSEIGMARLKGLEVGSTILHINTKDLKKFRIPLPPLAEQRKIADILSTWDRAIEATEALLATARTQKRALMQTLLTGKRRFPEFEGEEWKEVRLGDVLREVKRPVAWSDDDLYRLVSVRRRSGGLFHREDLYGRDIKTKNLKNASSGDFLISKMQVVHGAMGLVRDEFDGMQISGSYIAINSKDKNRLNIEFFDWLSRMPEMYHRAYLCSYGVHIEKMTFNFSLFLKERVKLPSSVKEQARIVEVLDCAEREVMELDQHITKLRTEKKALMQQLLTGKRRVVV
jgi:type I restriction enzyme S subunit